MVEKNKVVVKIAGNEYVICGSESPEYIQKIALLVDRKLLEITRKNHLLSTSMASVLMAVNVVDELVKTQEAQGKTEFELGELRKKHQEMKEESSRLKSENLRLKDINSQMQIELTKRETELKEVRNSLAAIQNSRKANE